MKYKIVHTTEYDYEDLVPVCQNLLCLTPRSTPTQLCTRHRLAMRPRPALTRRRTDYFGNSVHYTSIDQSHRKLRIRSTSSVECLPNQLPFPEASPCWESVCLRSPSRPTPTQLEDYQFVFPSHFAPHEAELAEYARQSLAPGRPILEALQDLNRRVFDDFEYDPSATTVATPVREVFEMRRGVCQDLAHLMLSALRPHGLAVRYVSGYLRTRPPEGQPRLVGADASHAWIAVHCGELGWIDLDPTNNVFPNDEHITLAWGRDFRDVCPVIGMYVGGGAHQLRVSVDVAPI